MKLQCDGLAADGFGWSLPARGVWIEISRIGLSSLSPVRRSPQGECGLKFLLGRNARNHQLSLPAGGVWIEIMICGSARGACTGRSPQGECGLKLHVTVEHVQFRRRSPQGECGLKWDELGRQRLALVSLPARGVWIEITKNISVTTCTGVSLPARGVWIEIQRGEY